MKRITQFAAAAALLAVAAPSFAAVTIRSGASVVQPSENVQLNIDINPGDAILRGTTNQTNSIVLFRSSTDNLVSGPQGQARIEAIGSSLDQLTFSLENGSTFTSAEFNILASVGGLVTLQALGTGGSILQTLTPTVGSNGQNFFGFLADASTPISSITVQASTAQVSSIGQFRLGGVALTPVAPVPEPATWAMMLVGFGAVGYSMRRRKAGYSPIQAV